ncbi:MAG: AAA family ATPase [Pseudoalteromonas sp.]|nr:AAA family ATPase [Pseudoalteromonas sp.]
MVTTQWGVDNIARFIKKAKSLDFAIGEPANSYDEVYWFLGASYGGDDDQTERFLRDGIWENGTDGKYTDKVKEIRKGDKIAIKSAYTQTHGLPFDNKGKMSSVMDIKAIGVVTENLNDGKTLKVDWHNDFKKLTWYIYTYQPRIWKVIPNNKERKALVDFTFNGEKQDFSIFVNSDDEFTDVSKLSSSADSSLNTILYGPPGTGKTYHSIQAAVKAAEPEMYSALGIDESSGSTPEQRAELTRLYKELYDSGRIRFVTFHQSYGYEEFVEGLKASSDDGNISYDVEDGVFKAISIQAEKFLKPKEAESNYSFEKAWQVFTEQLSEEEFVEVQMSKTTFKVLDFNDSRIFFEKKSGSQDHTLSISTLKAIFEARREYNSGLGVYYRPLVKYLKELSEPEQMSAIERQNFVLIIDEINRGNISKIFGELITLIEPSKRLGQSEAIEVTLPYSGDKFSVPDNLYIIGTMNTADRSLALMDTALRRRFDFVEMMPDYNVLHNEEGLPFTVESDGFEIDLARLLETMNKRISALYDREHQLGHAFLMPVVKAIAAGDDEKALHELKSCFQNKIIPLLAEYFFEDWQKIRLVLGDNQKPEAYQLIKQSDVDFDALFGDTEDVGDVADEVQDFRLIKSDSERWTDPLTYVGIYSAGSLTFSNQDEG